jgi:hypothetical protein
MYLGSIAVLPSEPTWLPSGRGEGCRRRVSFLSTRPTMVRFAYRGVQRGEAPLRTLLFPLCQRGTKGVDERSSTACCSGYDGRSGAKGPSLDSRLRGNDNLNSTRS